MRKLYYRDPDEDGLIMWAHDIDQPAYLVAAASDRVRDRLARPRSTTMVLEVTVAVDGRANTCILGIETVCDETAAAVVVGGANVLSSVVSSQVDLHARFGGVVPEIAGRAHVEMLTPVIAQAIVEAGIEDDRIDAVAATVGPGLVGSLLVGVSAAKALALVWDVPFVAVNHLEAHLYAALLEEPELQLPVVVLLVSGGHTMLVEMQDHGKYRLLGPDDRRRRRRGLRQGRAVPRSRLPGGPAIDRIAMSGDPDRDRVPASDPRRGARLLVQRAEDRGRPLRARQPGCEHRRRRRVVPAGGRRRAVDEGSPGRGRGRGEAACASAAAWRRTRCCAEQFLDVCEADGLHGFLPSRPMCTDNAAMIASAAWWRLAADGPSPLDTGADPSLGLALID